ncbi:hypothetical protein MUK42_14819 [Musa troglodytarum]|uniref:Uncharacterized protein n=1 Tax=Musa troglodytarum TaxID=320322 RepID=A0A9E7KTB6_9LILI|nr:hypothetical protein MUK42_14819 [Musa troglodytarum]
MFPMFTGSCRIRILWRIPTVEKYVVERIKEPRDPTVQDGRSFAGPTITTPSITGSVPTTAGVGSSPNAVTGSYVGPTRNRPPGTNLRRILGPGTTAVSYKGSTYNALCIYLTGKEINGEVVDSLLEQKRCSSLTKDTPRFFQPSALMQGIPVYFPCSVDFSSESKRNART